MDKVKTENRWVQRLLIDKATLKVMEQNGLQSSAIPGLERGDCLCCDINFEAPYRVRIHVEPTGYLVRFGEHLYYFASQEAEKEHNFRCYNQRIIYSVSIPPDKTQEEHLHKLARKHPEFFRDRLRPALEEKGIEVTSFIATVEAALDLWAREFPAEFVGEPAAYEVIIHEDDAGAVSALLAGIFEDIQPVKLLEGYLFSCVKPLHDLTMTEAIKQAKILIAQYID